VEHKTRHSRGGSSKIGKKEMENNAVSVLGVSEVRWKGQGEISSDDYTVYYSGGERSERDIAMVHTNTVRSVVKKMRV